MSGQHVVIVGGSYAGVTAAKACAAAGLRVTVVEPKDRFDTTFGTVRAMVVDGFEDTLWFPFDRVFPAGSPSRFVRGWATGVDTSSNVLTFAPVAGGAPVALSFDYLILACGTRNSCAWFGKTHSRAEYKAALAATRKAIAAAPLVLVVGAGMVGVELAGEVKHAHPAKPVVLASSGGVLAHDAHAVPQFIARITKEVAAAGLDFRAGVRVGGLDALAAREDVEELSPGVFAARGGAGATFPVAVGAATERVGVLIASTGQVPTTGWLAGGGLAGALDKRGFVTVGRTYQVAGQRAVFAVGDCAATAGGEAKGAMRAEAQAHVAAANVIALARGADAGALKLGPNVAVAGPFAVVPVGPKHGAAQLPGFCGKNIVSFMAKIKGKDYLAGMLGKKYTGFSLKEAVAANVQP